ncbi:MAG: class I SAM-dependent methyltransferase [Verrucomicrobiota bacterium]
MKDSTVSEFYSAQMVVDHYARATASVGLWKSEEKIFTRVFADRDASLLELGCGVGRIAFGMHELGYRHLLASDFARAMVKEARRIATTLEYAIPFKVEDATKLSFEDDLFDGAIFGFNGMMQIPGAENRQKAMAEVYRVIRPGAFFVFTTHDRELPKFRTFWEAEKKRWRRGEQHPELVDFGDRYEETDMGMLFIHVPTPQEIRDLAKSVGFRVEADVMRSVIANEPPRVREFSDDCRFWVLQKPE